MRNVAVVGFAQRQMKEFDGSPTMVELLVPLFADLYEQTGFTRKDIGFWCSGSSDYLAGRSFSFVSAVDAIGALPPVNESHVEMRSEEHTSELKSLMRISYAVFCLKKKNTIKSLLQCNNLCD